MLAERARFNGIIMRLGGNIDTPTESQKDRHWGDVRTAQKSLRFMLYTDSYSPRHPSFKVTTIAFIPPHTRRRTSTHTAHTHTSILTRHQIKTNRRQAKEVKGRVIVLQHDGGGLFF